MVVPSELNAWVSVSRDDAVSGLPSTATNGFAATWSSVMPDASTNSASRKSGNERAPPRDRTAGSRAPRPDEADDDPVLVPEAA